MAANPGTLREAVEKYTVHQFDRSMIQKCLESMDLNYLVDRGGDFVVEFRYDEKIGTELTVFFIAGGEG